MQKKIKLLAITIAGGCAAASHAVVLRFDDLPRNKKVGEQYAAQGVHFSLTDWAVMGGLDEGDPGFWSLRGTNGTAFMGVNGVDNPTYEMNITFDTAVTSVSFDASRSEGSSTGNGLAVQYWLGGVQVFSSLTTFQGINVWTTFGYAGPIDRVSFQGMGTGFHPYGVDNFRYTVPSPAGLAAFGFIAMSTLQRRRGNRARG